MNKVAELFVYSQKKGFRETVSRIKNRYLSVGLFTLFHTYLQDVSIQMRKNTKVEYHVGSLEELKKYRKENINLPREFYVDQTHGGTELYLGFYEGNLALIGWVFKKGEYSRFFSFEDGSTCELNYIITLPQYRGKGLSSDFMNHMCNQLKMKGIQKVVIAIATSNILMIKSMRRTEFNEFKKVKSYFSFVSKTIV